MRKYLQWGAAAAGMAVVIGFGAVATMAQGPDKGQIVMTRQGIMKQQSHDEGPIYAYINDKGVDQATAVKSAQDLLMMADKLPGLWPPGTSSTDMPNKTRARPEIWQQLDKFNAIVPVLKADEQKLLDALQKGDKGTAKAAFSDMVRNGCSACHGSFRGPALNRS